MWYTQSSPKICSKIQHTQLTVCAHVHKLSAAYSTTFRCEQCFAFYRAQFPSYIILNAFGTNCTVHTVYNKAKFVTFIYIFGNGAHFQIYPSICEMVLAVEMCLAAQHNTAQSTTQLTKSIEQDAIIPIIRNI